MQYVEGESGFLGDFHSRFFYTAVLISGFCTIDLARVVLCRKMTFEQEGGH